MKKSSQEAMPPDNGVQILNNPLTTFSDINILLVKSFWCGG